MGQVSHSLPATVQYVLVPKAAESDAPPVITAVAIHPQGQWLAAAGDDHIVRLWQLPTGRLERELTGHRDWVRSVVFSPDGHQLITAGTDGQVLAWRLSEGGSPVRLAQLERGLFDLAIHPQGHELFVVGFDSRMRVVPLLRRGPTTERTCCSGELRTVAVAPNGKLVACAGRNGVVNIWSAPGCHSHRKYPIHKRRVRSLTFTPDSQVLITAGEDRRIVLTRVDDGHELLSLSSGPAKILALAMCGEKLLASAGSDNLIRLWDLETGTQLARLEGHSGSVAALAGQGQTLVSGSFDATVRVWKVNSHDELQARRRQETDSAVR